MSTEEAEDLYNCLALVNGGKPALASYEFIDMLAYSPINHFFKRTGNVQLFVPSFKHGSIHTSNT
jgi:hypothetical protein